MAGRTAGATVAYSFHFLRLLSPSSPIFHRETALQALQARTVELEGDLAGIEARLQGLGQSLHRLLLLELEYVRALRQGELAWVRTLMQDMREGKLTWDAEALRGHPERLFIAPEHPETTLRLVNRRTEQPS